MSTDINTVRDLTYNMVNMGDVENSFGAVVSPEIIIQDSSGKEYVIDDFYLRGDDKAFMILTEKIAGCGDE